MIFNLGKKKINPELLNSRLPIDEMEFISTMIFNLGKR
jgi:hypothetical protein